MIFLKKDPDEIFQQICSQCTHQTSSFAVSQPVGNFYTSSACVIDSWWWSVRTGQYWWQVAKCMVFMV